MNKNDKYIDKFIRSNPGFNDSPSAYIKPTIDYLRRKIIECSYNYLLVYENQKQNETISIENFLEIRDKTMFLIMLKEHGFILEEYLDKICEELGLMSAQFLEGKIEHRLRYVALYIVQIKGIWAQSSFDLKTVEGSTLPGEPLVSYISRATLEIQYEFINYKGLEDKENFCKVILSLMVYLVMFRIKTDWDEER